MDKLDFEILKELELDCRQSNTRLAKKIGTNKTLINYRIDRLTKKKIISKYKYIANQVILGKLSFGLLVSFKDISFEEEKKIIEQINKMKGTAWVKSISGNWDVIIVIIEKNIINFNKALQKIFDKFGQNIKQYVFYSDYEGNIKIHNYLYKTPNNNVVKYHSGDIIRLNPIDYEVYSILKDNPKIPLLQIAKELKKSYDTIKTKFSKLKSQKILLRSTIKINIQNLGYNDYLCLFNIQPDQAKIKSFQEFCLKNLNIIRYAKCLGHFNIILNIHAKDMEELKTIIGSIKKKFSDVINSQEIIQIT